ncbi:Hypothetical protein GbCGDNIH9_0214 [Granulibacter bethesdensis]|uniref:Uncharacterized protein n=1 Tax=Granulibacter bethesdensis TaxID=364410 RepID=A0AAC9KB09_9PROT|nr:hypothetical protein [Granulibacter bethesdensis]APH53437.1 Hypothetical protein GbCGDNIH9_0214 [Granulibacter bethesdensis]APH61015.1 Hypothetical protein GbCGDNIH8_0214 [Granulibacter bethesdensis]
MKAHITKKSLTDFLELSIAAVISLFLTVSIAIYARLIPLSRWQADEFITFAHNRDTGLPFLLDRFFHWSPRPVSEFILWLYYLASTALHRPMITAIIGSLWAVLIISGLAILRRSSNKKLLQLCLCLALPAFYLLDTDPTEVFFWPQSAVAYVTTLAAITLLFWEIASNTPITSTRSIVLLIIAAWSSETGAFFVFLFTIMNAPFAFSEQPQPPVFFRWSLPLLGSGLILFLLLLGRVGTPELPIQTGHYIHHVLPSAQAATGVLMEELGFSTQSQMPLGWIHLLFFLGARWCWSSMRRDGARIRAGLLTGFALALLSAAYISILAAYYQFDYVCCARHATIRESYILLAVMALGFASARWSLIDTRYLRAVSALPFAVALLIALPVRLPALQHDHALIDQVTAAKAATWVSGTAHAEAMTFYQQPDGMIVHNGYLPAGNYILGQTQNWIPTGIMQFFHKQKLTVTAAPPP